VILVTARIDVPPSSRRELLQVVLHSAAGVRRDPAALAVHVYEDLESPTVVCMESRWSTRDALGHYLGSPRFGSLLGAVEVLGTASDVAVNEVAEEQTHGSITLRVLRDTIRERREPSEFEKPRPDKALSEGEGGV
jgi:quinol monooxygenase YgiN